jgi:hypothetical protein
MQYQFGNVEEMSYVIPQQTGTRSILRIPLITVATPSKVERRKSDCALEVIIEKLQ